MQHVKGTCYRHPWGKTWTRAGVASTAADLAFRAGAMCVPDPTNGMQSAECSAAYFTDPGERHAECTAAHFTRRTPCTCTARHLRFLGSGVDAFSSEVSVNGDSRRSAALVQVGELDVTWV